MSGTDPNAQTSSSNRIDGSGVEPASEDPDERGRPDANSFWLISASLHILRKSNAECRRNCGNYIIWILSWTINVGTWYSPSLTSDISLNHDSPTVFTLELGHIWYMNVNRALSKSSPCPEVAANVNRLLFQDRFICCEDRWEVKNLSCIGSQTGHVQYLFILINAISEELIYSEIFHTNQNAR